MRSLLTLLRETRKTRAARLAVERLDDAAKCVATYHGEKVRLAVLHSHYRSLIATCDHANDGHWHRYAELQDARVAVEEQMTTNEKRLIDAENHLAALSN